MKIKPILNIIGVIVVSYIVISYITRDLPISTGEVFGKFIGFVVVMAIFNLWWQHQNKQKK